MLYNFKLNILKTAKGVNDFKVSIQTNITAIPRFRCLLYGLSMLYLFCDNMGAVQSVNEILREGMVLLKRDKADMTCYTVSSPLLILCEVQSSWIGSRVTKLATVYHLRHGSTTERTD